MNEKEVNEQVSAVDQPESAVPEQTGQELTLEEKLSLREKQLAERENALTIRERTMDVSKMLSKNGYPSELAEILRIDTDEEKNAETVKKVIEILNGIAPRAVATVSTGMEHTCPTSNYDGFMRGFNN